MWAHVRFLLPAIAIVLFLGPSLRQPAAVTLTYDIPERATLHEPVLMSVVLDNDSDQSAYIDIRHEVSFRFESVAPDGSASAAQIREAKGGALSGEGDMPPHFRLEHEVVLDEFLTFNQLGAHRLVVTFGGRIEPRDPNARVTVPRSRAFTVNVDPRDEQRLVQLCRTWLTDVTNLNAQQSIRAMRRIAWIQDDVAAPCIRSAIELDHSFEPLWAALVRLGSARARSALEELTRNPDPGLAATARIRLSEFDRRR